MSPILQSLIERSQPKLAALLTEASDEIDAAIVAASTEAQAQEVPAKLPNAIGAVVNIDKNAFEFSIGWAVRHKLTSSCEIPDPDQAELPMEQLPNNTQRN